MDIYLISDSLTRQSLSLENINIKDSWLFLSRRNNPILFVESAWCGHKDRWKYKIASYSDYPERTNEKLVRLVKKAKKKGIPTVFWNKEDSIHFDRFIDSAKHFDHIFTVDANCIQKYREIVPVSTTVDMAMFPIQPRIHHFQGFNFQKNEANFVGSFSKHIHNKRRECQEMLFSSALRAGLPVTIFDRNSNRKSDNYRYPEQEFRLKVMPALDYVDTANIYRNFTVSLNVNTIEDSPTMFSRRVVEILACGGILVSTPSLAMNELFAEYCHLVQSEDEAIELFQRLRYGPSKLDLEMAKAGSDYVLQNFTWQQFLNKIRKVVGYD